MVTCKGGHTGHFSALTKLLKFRFETKNQIVFVTNDGFDKPQQVSSSCHFWLQSFIFVCVFSTLDFSLSVSSSVKVLAQDVQMFLESMIW